METKTIELLAAILFILIAVVGGGFVIKEVQIPRVPKWARIISGFLGLIFFVLFIIDIVGPPPDGDRHDREQIIYSYKNSDISKHGFKLINIFAKCIHNPPQVGDSIKVEFALQNTNKNPITVLGTFVVGRDPDGSNRDFGSSNENRVIQPNEIIKTEGIIIVDVSGMWKFGPSYDLGNDIYPGEWQRFPVRVEQ